MYFRRKKTPPSRETDRKKQLIRYAKIFLFEIFLVLGYFGSW